ncbi:MAG: hypothetical protein JWM56_112 [Candidatus Peribacteria bacterium]|nr:hypothetical protein [Candidatus Peribacteria bacterium]
MQRSSDFLDTNTVKRRVAIYIRVSTSEQRIDGYSLEAQNSRLSAYVNNNPALNLITKPGWIYTDVHTGSDLNRPSLTQLLEDVKQGKYDAVLVWKIDRLSRNLKHLLIIFEELEKNNVSFISLQENIDFKGPIGKLIFQIFGAIAQFERELIKGRTQMGKIASAEAGNYTGTHIPYGLKPKIEKGKKGKKLEVDMDEKETVENIYDWYIYDHMGDVAIAKKLNGLKIPRASWEKEGDSWVKHNSKAKWTHKMVTYILTDTIYRGEFVANTKDDSGSELPPEQWTTVAIPAVVSELTYQQAQYTRLNKPGGAAKNDYLLSGKLVDMDLAFPKKFVGAKRTKGGFSYRRKPFEREGIHYSVFEVTGRQIEEYVWGKIMEALKDPEIFIQKYLSKEYANPDRLSKMQTELINLRAQIIEDEMAIQRIEKSYEDGTYSEEKMAKKASERTVQITNAQGRIQQIEDEMRIISSVDIEVQKLKEASEQVKYRLDNLEPRHKKVLCGLFLERVEMRRKKVEGVWQVQAETYFRFNPSKFTEPVVKGRTTKGLTKANIEEVFGKNDKFGRPGWT